MTWHVKTFNQLTSQQLYQILRLRAQVFVVEQDCVYQDVDNKDQKAFHVFLDKDATIFAYARIFNKGEYFEQTSIGRVVVPEDQRTFGYGHELMKQCIQAIKEHYQETRIKISAQTYLKKFYQSHGFQQIGEEYLEDGIPHIAMLKQ